MGKGHIKVYIDAVSPFGYLGYWMVRNSPVFKSVETEYVPILLGGLMKSCNNTPPLMIKNKDKWIEGERTGWSKQFGIPMREKVPTGFPLPTVNAQRVLCAIQLKHPAKLSIAIDTIYKAFWAPHELPSSMPKPSKGGADYAINSVDDLKILLSHETALGKELAEEVVAAISTPEVKAALIKNTEAAFADGAFGLPWYHCTNEAGETRGFWGFDHLGQVVKFMGLGDLEGASKTLRPLL